MEPSTIPTCFIREPACHERHGKENMMYVCPIIHSEFHCYPLKECYIPSINVYEYEHKCLYLSSFILPIFCNGQECYLDRLILYFVFIRSASISVHLFSFSVFLIYILRWSCVFMLVIVSQPETLGPA